MTKIIPAHRTRSYHQRVDRATKLLVVLLLLLASTGAFAEQMLWSLDGYPLNLDQIGQALKRKNVEEGLVPVGIESDGRTMTVLSLHNSRLGASSYTLQSFDDFELFKQALTEKVQQGITPVDVSLEKQRLYALFLKLEATPEDWAWVVCPPSAPEIKKATDPWVEKGYLPMGITMVEGTFATLLVRFKDRSLRGWTLSVASGTAAVTDLMRQRLAAGELPCGILTGTQATNIVFLSRGPAVASGASAPPPDQGSPSTDPEEQTMTLPEIESFIRDNYVSSP